MYDAATFRIGVGIAALLVVALLPVRQDTGGRRAFLGFFIGAAFTLALAALLLHLGDFSVEGAGDQLVKGELEHVEEAQVGGQLPRNLVVIEGSSQTDLGLNPYVVEAELGRLGYPTTVVTLAADGGNHLERYQHLRRLLDEMQRHSVAFSPNTVLLMEVHQRYDADPLRYFDDNRNALRTFYYSTFDNLLFAGHYYRLLGQRLDGKKREQLAALLGHVVISEFNIGFLPLMTRFDTLMGEPTYTPYPRTAPAEDFKSYDPRGYAPGTPPARVGIPYAAIAARSERLKALFGETLSGSAYFQVPSLDPVKMRYGHAFCGSPAGQGCIDGSDPSIYGPLDQARFYFNRDHLSMQGAKLYSEWFANQLVAHRLVVR